MRWNYNNTSSDLADAQPPSPQGEDFRIVKVDRNMKATGIVRRIEARVITTQKCDKAL